MEIGLELANNIIKELKGIIEKELNFIDLNGVIVASTDATRVGGYHQGGKEAIEKNIVVKVNEDGEYSGAKKGVNFPLELDSTIVGAMGISGEAKEVEKYGKIIKKMSEILIKEANLQKKEEENNEKEKIFINSLLYKNYRMNNKMIFSEYSKEIEDKESCVVILGNYGSGYSLDKINKNYKEIKKTVKKYKGYTMLSQDTIYIIMFNLKKEEIQRMLQGIYLEEEFYFGVGEIKRDINQLINSLEEGLIALKWAVRNREKSIFYCELDVEILLQELDKKIKKEYVKKIFGGMEEKDIKEYRKIMFFYERYNGSLHKIAKELGIHINTLQYKINRLEEKIGFDMRKYSDFFKLKLAFLILDI